MSLAEAGRACDLHLSTAQSFPAPAPATAAERLACALQLQLQVGSQPRQSQAFTCVPGGTSAARTTVSVEPDTTLSTAEASLITVATKVQCLAARCSVPGCVRTCKSQDW